MTQGTGATVGTLQREEEEDLVILSSGCPLDSLQEAVLLFNGCREILNRSEKLGAPPGQSFLCQSGLQHRRRL